MATLTRNYFIPFVDKNRLEGKTGDPVWVRVDKSTVFEFAFNPQEETYGFIDMANDTTQVKSYQFELPQEIILDSDNDCYAAMYAFYKRIFTGGGTGGDAVIPVLIGMPNIEDPTKTDGFMWSQASVSPDNINSVDGKTSFTLKLNGDAVEGEITVGEDKAVTFTAGEAAAPAVAMFSNDAETHTTKSSK